MKFLLLALALTMTACNGHYVNGFANGLNRPFSTYQSPFATYNIQGKTFNCITTGMYTGCY